MDFLSHGDFSFPLTWTYYMYKQLCMWSFRTGAPNPDGIIKMPGRLPELLVFGLWNDNLAVSYFFIFSSLLIVFAAFYYFAAKFLEIKNAAIKWMGALLFTVNPVFLGNLAKLGLIVAASMLPVSLVAIKQLFEKKKWRYLLLWILCLNISLIHPFTFIVNTGVSGLYFVYLTSKNKHLIFDNLHKLLLFGGLAILLSAYFLLPMASMHTLSKDVINDSAAKTATDYTQMIEILSTRDLLTGFSLSKDVVIDFAYYDGVYGFFYFAGVIAFYILLFGLYVRLEKRLKESDKRRIALLVGVFLLLILLAAVTVLHVETIIKFLIQLPGGWAFRSPLKWQLYIPMSLVTMLVVLLTYIQTKRRRMFAYIGLIIIFLLMNGFLLGEVYKKLLTPRSVTHFKALQQKEFKHDNILLVDNDACATTDIENRRIRTELKQVLVSEDIQLKHISPHGAANINLSSYDYIMDCAHSLKTLLAQAYDFKLEQTFVGNRYQLYVNRNPEPYAYANTALYATAPHELHSKYAFVTATEGRTFDYVANDANVTMPVTNLMNPYEDLSFGAIRAQKISASVGLQKSAQPASLYIRDNGKPLYYLMDEQGISFATSAQPGYQQLPPKRKDGFVRLPITVPQDGQFHINYSDPAYDYTNLVPNSSLEKGAWQKRVDDCYAYDDHPTIDMKIDREHKTDGQQSLELLAKSHVACSGPSPIRVEDGHYLLGFDYQSDGGKEAGYAVMLNKPNRTIVSDRLLGTPKQWESLTTTIAATKNATAMKLLLHSYPDTPGLITGAARYDNLRLVRIPDIQDTFFFVQPPSQVLQLPSSVQHTVINPAKINISVRKATTPFYLMTNESFSDKWQLSGAQHSAISWLPFSLAASPADSHHFKANGSMNGWYIDPAALCATQKSCTRNQDGSYDLELTAEFTPQRWFYVGLLVSGVSFVGCVVYATRTYLRSRGTERQYIWRR